MSSCVFWIHGWLAKKNAICEASGGCRCRLYGFGLSMDVIEGSNVLTFLVESYGGVYDGNGSTRHAMSGLTVNRSQMISNIVRFIG